MNRTQSTQSALGWCVELQGMLTETWVAFRLASVELEVGAVREAAVKENRRLMKDWTAALIKTSTEASSSVRDSVKEVAKVLELPKSTKAAHAA